MVSLLRKARQCDERQIPSKEQFRTTCSNFLLTSQFYVAFWYLKRRTVTVGDLTNYALVVRVNLVSLYDNDQCCFMAWTPLGT